MTALIVDTYVTHVVSFLHRCDKFEIIIDAETSRFAALCKLLLLLKFESKTHYRWRKGKSNFQFPSAKEYHRSLIFHKTRLLTRTLYSCCRCWRMCTITKASFKPCYIWYLMSQNDKAFKEHKPGLVSQLVLTLPSSLHHPPMLEPDASRVRSVLLILWQRHGKEWRLAHRQSKFLLDKNRNYDCAVGYHTELPHSDLVVDHSLLVPVIQQFPSEVRYP